MNARSSAITGAALFLFALGAVWAQGESPAAAQTALDQAIALGRAGRWTEAETVLLEGQRRFPSDSRFPVELAGVAYRQGRFHAAKGYLHDALRLDAEDRYANDFLGTLYLLDGNVAATLKYWNRIEKPLIQHVLFVPPPPLDPLLRDRTFDISAGQVFTYRRLLQTEANVAALQTFSECRFAL
ncbi:MAG TPA: hypothetical protein VG672_04915, partial [Bryobacteraceae bacterium]|nr:hypothetical protein [Bryobacteraceae bacterium]